MKLDVKSLVNASVGETESFSIELFKEKIDDDIVAERIKGNLTVTKLDDELLGRFTGTAKLNAVCDRCAGDFELELPFKFSQEYSLDRSFGDEDKLGVTNQFEIDLLEPLRQEILAAIPVKNLCKEDCAGICPNCGINLNEAKCTCKKVTKEKKTI